MELFVALENRLPGHVDFHANSSLFNPVTDVTVAKEQRPSSLARGWAYGVFLIPFVVRPLVLRVTGRSLL